MSDWRADPVDSARADPAHALGPRHDALRDAIAAELHRLAH